DAGIEEFGPWPDLCFVKANVDFKLHRLERVKADLELSPALRASSEGRALAADLDLEEGRYEEARSGYESLVADDRSWSALARYEDVAAPAPRPELHQALGDVHRRVGRPEEARPWHDLALAAYLDSVERGGVHYFHHLAHFYLESRPDPAEAVRWARADHELRPNLETRALLGAARGAEIQDVRVSPTSV